MLTLRQALWNNHPEPNAKFDSDQPSVVHLKGIFVLVTKV